MEQKTIALLGATGRTGLPFLKEVLDKGYIVKALVRDPQKLTLKSSNLHMIKGDVLNKTDLETALCDCQAVISLIGHVKGSPADLQTSAARQIIEIMNRQNIKRLISLTGGGVRDSVNDSPGMADKMIVFIMKYLAGKDTRNTLMDGIQHADLIMQSNLDWTIVRAPVLTDEPAKGTIKVGNVGMVKGIKLTREDLASFLADIIEGHKYVREMPFVVN